MATKGNSENKKTNRRKPLGQMDIHSKKSDRGGLIGLFETLFRRFRVISFIVLMVGFMFFAALALGVSIAPGVAFFIWCKNLSMNWHPILHYIMLGCGISFGYLLYGLSVIFVVPFFHFLFPFKVKPFRAPIYSLPAIVWFIHNGFTYLVRYTFLEFLSGSPLNNLFYRMMGMKIGKGVAINTANISDPALIEIGDHSIIGGSATLLAHYGQRGYLVVEPVIIGANVTVGLKASIMGGAKIGNGALIKPHQVVLPKTVIKPGEKF